MRASEVKAARCGSAQCAKSGRMKCGSGVRAGAGSRAARWPQVEFRKIRILLSFRPESAASSEVKPDALFGMQTLFATLTVNLWSRLASLMLARLGQSQQSLRGATKGVGLAAGAVARAHLDQGRPPHTRADQPASIPLTPSPAPLFYLRQTDLMGDLSCAATPATAQKPPRASSR